MNYLRFTSYAYIFAAVLFAIEAYNQYQSGERNQAILMGILAAASVFLFFFRRKFAKKFDGHNKKT